MFMFIAVLENSQAMFSISLFDEWGFTLRVFKLRSNSLCSINVTQSVARDSGGHDIL